MAREEIKLRRYQRRGVRRMYYKFNGRVLLADEMGLGKTIQAIALYHKHYKGKRLVVIVPASLKYQWQNELMRFGIRSEVLSGRTPPLYKSIVGGPKVLIINYDILTNVGGKKQWLDWLREWKPYMMIVDEAQALKNRQSQRSKATKKIAKKCPKIVLLTGTPLTNAPKDLYPLISIIKKDLFPNFFDYAYKFCEPKLEYGRMTFNGSKNEDLLHRKLRRHMMVRRLKKNVLKSLPPKTRTVVPVDLPPKEMKEYTTLRDQFVRWLKVFAPKIGKSERQANRLVQMGYLKRLAGISKTKIIHEWIDNFLEETDEKLIVFGIHKKMLLPLYDKYKKQAVLVNGSVTGKERQKRVEKFQKDKSCRIFFGNIQAAGTGWNGSCASTVLFVELDWVPANMVQAEDRPHRIGQKNPVKIYFLVAKGTIEELLCRVLERKQLLSDQIVDGVKKRSDSINILDLLEKQLIKRRK